MSSLLNRSLKGRTFASTKNIYDIFFLNLTVRKQMKKQCIKLNLHKIEFDSRGTF